MSDMENSDVAPEQPVDAAVEPAAAPAPEVPADAPEAGQVTPEPTPNPEPTAEELQAEIEELQAEIAAQNAQNDAAVAAPAPEATPVLARTPSSESPTQQPEAAPAVDEAPLPLADAVRVLIVFIKDHRTAGDSDLAAALADVEAALAAQDA